MLAIAVLLFAQGVRICLHNAAGHVDSSAATTRSALMLESVLALGDIASCPIADDIPLSGVLKEVAAAPSLLPFVAALLLLLPPRPSLRVARPPDLLPRRSRGYGLRPPPRAPPR